LLGTSSFAQRKFDAYFTLRLSITAGDTETSVSLRLATIRLGGELLDGAGEMLADDLARLRPTTK
jgi:hypothetical protein